MALTRKDLTTVNALTRFQRDRKQQVTFRKTLTINPQQLVRAENNIYIYGPFEFNICFTRPPDITFGQSADPAISRLGGVPLVVQTWVSTWTFQSSSVIGFSLGVLALTAIPSGLVKHSVSCIAIGQASNYKMEGIDSSWQQSYQRSQASYLHTNPSEAVQP